VVVAGNGIRRKLWAEVEIVANVTEEAGAGVTDVEAHAVEVDADAEECEWEGESELLVPHAVNSGSESGAESEAQAEADKEMEMEMEDFENAADLDVAADVDVVVEVDVKGDDKLDSDWHPVMSGDTEAIGAKCTGAQPHTRSRGLATTRLHSRTRRILATVAASPAQKAANSCQPATEETSAIPRTAARRSRRNWRGSMNGDEGSHSQPLRLTYEEVTNTSKKRARDVTAAPQAELCESKAGDAAHKLAQQCKKRYETSRADFERKKPKSKEEKEAKNIKVYRADLKAMQKLQASGHAINQDFGWGHVSGVLVGETFSDRASLRVVGLHQPPMSGIACATYPKKGGNKFATSIVLSGGYECDHDNGNSFEYTGEGGNDFLGNKLQTEDQAMTRGNLGLKSCFDYDVPVRVIRRVSTRPTVLRYDGLYRVSDWKWDKALAEGEAGSSAVGSLNPKVLKFTMQRLADQQPLQTERSLTFGTLRSHGIRKNKVTQQMPTENEREFARFKAKLQRQLLQQDRRKGKDHKRVSAAEYRRSFERERQHLCKEGEDLEQQIKREEKPKILTQVKEKKRPSQYVKAEEPTICKQLKGQEHQAHPLQ